MPSASIRMLAPWRAARSFAASPPRWSSPALALAVLAAPAQATVLGPRAGHSPNADDIRTAYWVAIVDRGRC